MPFCSTVAIFAAVAALAVAVSAASSAPALHVVTRTTVGGYSTTSGFSKASKTFGAPYSESQGPTECVARWRGGLTIAWHRRPAATAWAKACVKFSWAKVADKTWRTDEGLRVGVAKAAIKRRYPTAAKKKGYWNLTPRRNPSLQAWTKNGRIAYFQIVRR